MAAKYSGEKVFASGLERAAAKLRKHLMNERKAVQNDRAAESKE